MSETEKNLDPWTDVEIYNGKPANRIDAVAFSKMQIWCNEAKAVDFIEDSGCDTLWINYPENKEGSASPCSKNVKTNHIATYTAPKLGINLCSYFTRNK